MVVDTGGDTVGVEGVTVVGCWRSIVPVSSTKFMPESTNSVVSSSAFFFNIGWPTQSTYDVNGSILFSFISLGPEYSYSTATSPPVPEESSISGFTNPRTVSVIVGSTNLPLLSTVYVPICFFFAPLPMTIFGFLYPLPTLTDLILLSLGTKSPHLAYIAVASGGITSVGIFYWSSIQIHVLILFLNSIQILIRY